MISQRQQKQKRSNLTADLINKIELPLLNLNFLVSE